MRWKKREENRNEWYNDVCQERLAAKLEARNKWLRSGRDEDREEYEAKRKDCKKVLRKCKREWIENEMKIIENENRKKNTKRYYQKINEHNKTYKHKMSGIRDSGGKVVESEGQYKEVWMKHFNELLNDNQQIEELLHEEDDEIVVQEPTLEEIKDVIKSSRNGKAPGKDGINNELLKYGGDELHENIYALISKIWKEETMPKEWESGQIVTLHKKGDQQNCSNYRGITLLSTTYKILSTIIQRRLTNATTNLVGQYQYGFRSGKSTTDAVHCIKQILERAYEYSMELDFLFIDFQQAFDNIRRGKLILAMKELKVPAKLRRLIVMTLKSTRVSVRTAKGETNEFTTNKGVRQGDSLSATLFNLVLEYVTRKISKGTLRTRGSQIIAYADDVVVITKRREITHKLVQEIIKEGEVVGLKINEAKTKLMRVGKKDQKIKVLR